MKTALRSLSMLLFIASTPLCSAVPTGTFGHVQNDFDDMAEHQLPRTSFWELSSYSQHIFNSNFKTEGYTSQHTSYTETETLLSYNYFIDSLNAISFGAGYLNNNIRWSQNPQFQTESFQHALVTLSAQSEQYCGWLWKINFGARFNLREQLATYVLYTHALWGRYSLSPWYAVHMGYAAETGLRNDKVWPIIGFDTELTPAVKLYAVYPFEFSITYQRPCSALSYALSTRCFRSRHRVGVHEPNPRGLVEYRNNGAEARITYECPPVLEARLYGGHTFGGELRITNRLDNDSTHYKFKAAPYLGGELTVRF